MSAGEWRRAGSAAAATDVATATPIQGANPIAQAPGAVRQVVHQVSAVRKPAAPTQGDQFDPFDEPLTDADVAMPRTDGPTSRPNESPAIGTDKSPVDGFDPFDAPADPPAQVEAGEAPASAPAAEPIVEAAEPVPTITAPDLPVVETAPEPEPVAAVEAPVPARRPATTYDVQQMFDDPRGTRVAPGVQGGAERAGQGTREVLPRGGRSPMLPGVEGRGPVSPTDAVDSPIGRPTGGVEESFPGPTQPEHREGQQGEGDLESQYQGAPGGYQFRQIDQPPQTPEQIEAHRRELEKERADNEKNCETIVAAVKSDDIKTVSLDIRTSGVAGDDYPFECGLGQQRFAPRSWSQITYMWKAAGLCHKPLYFEDVQLERYGHSCSPVLQPLMSGAHFFGTLPILPYKMGLETPNECIYTLGYYRPGNCAPYMIQAFPFTWRAAAFEGFAWTAGVIIIP